MILKWFVTFFVINVVSCIRSIQKIPSKYTQPSNADLVKSISDKNSFPDVVYPTSILDIANPFYYNTDNNYEVLEPFSEDVKSSYKLLSAITKTATKNSAGNVKNKTEINKGETPATDPVKILSVKENITECHSDTKDNCTYSEVIEEVIKTHNNTELILDNLGQNYDLYNVSWSEEVQNESCSKIPLLVRINIQVFKESYNESKEVVEIASLSQDNEEDFKQVKDSSNESSEEINSSSEEHNTELQDIKHSEFIEMLSVMLFDLLASTDNKTDILNTTLIDNESFERIVFESVDNLTNLAAFDLLEPNLTDLIVNINYSEPNLLNLTEPFRHINEESSKGSKGSKGSKEDYFLDLLISLCENNKTVETVPESEYFKNPEYLLSENCTDIYE